MRDQYSSTQKNIRQTAYGLFLKQGIRKTSMEEVATAAGVTRMTVYRAFPDKKDLVQAAFSLIPDALQTALDHYTGSSAPSLDACLQEIIHRLAALPAGDLPARLEELRIVYPDLFEQFDLARTGAIWQIFDHLTWQAEQEGRLRNDLNREVMRAFFSTTVTHILLNAGLRDLNLSADVIFMTVKEIFLHGILAPERMEK